VQFYKKEVEKGEHMNKIFRILIIMFTVLFILSVSIIPGSALGGNISVSTTPSGAYILLDGQAYSVLTPYIITGVLPGSHMIKLSHSQYDDWTTTVNVVEGSTTTISATLNKTAISVSSTPSGASIYLDGIWKGSTPFIITQVLPGSHIIKLTLNQYDDWTTMVDVVEGSTNTISATFSKIGSTQSPTPTIITSIITPTYTTMISATPIIEKNTPPSKTIDPGTPSGQIPNNASVSLHGEKTDVVMGEDILLRLSAVNLITKPKMHVQVIIIPPSGMSVTSSEFSKSAAGQFTANYQLEPGDGKDIEVRIRSNQVGDFNVNGRIIYYFGDDKEKAEDQTLNLPIKVRKEIGSDIVQTKTPAQKSIPGFELFTGISGLLLLAIILKGKR
jgi:hypothetical protein